MKNRKINRLLRQMKKISQDVNDTAICKKFEILIKSGDEVDISSQLLARIFEDPFEVDDKELPELYLLYFRHYRFLVKRLAKAEKKSAGQNKKRQAPVKGGSRAGSSRKTTVAKKPAAKRASSKKPQTSAKRTSPRQKI